MSAILCIMLNVLALTVAIRHLAAWNGMATSAMQTQGRRITEAVRISERAAIEPESG